MVFDPKLDIIGVLIEGWNPHPRYEMTQSLCKHDMKSKNHPGMKLVLVRVFSCKHPLMFLSFQSVSEWWRLVFKGGSNFWVSRWNPTVWRFSWNLFSNKFSWYAVSFFFNSLGNCVEILLWSLLRLKWLRPSGQAQVMLYCIRAEGPKTTPCVATCSLFSSTLSWYFYYIDTHYM